MRDTMTKTAIVIGGGMGGLCTACLLCKEGYKVTVLERHYKIGGGLHTFMRDGINYETGMHYISGFQHGGILRSFYSYLGIFDKLKIKALDSDSFDSVYVNSDKKNYSIAAGKQNFVDVWSKSFPEERQNLQRYTEAIYDIANRFPLCNLRPSDASAQELMEDEDVVMPVRKFIEKYISNPRLRNLLAWCNPLYAGDPDSTPAYVHCIINRLYIEGASRFVGGSQQLADEMCHIIEESGGKVICGDGVAKIVAKERHADYVVTEKGLQYSADLYISSLHPAALIDLLDDASQFTHAYRNRLATLPNTYSAFILFIKMKKNTFPYYNRNVFYVDDYDEIWNVSDSESEKWPMGLMAMTPPKSTGDEQFAESLIVSCLMHFDTVRQWENSTHGNRPQEYKDFKKECEQKVLVKLHRLFPNLDDCMESYFSATPLTIRDYTGSKDGSMYGYVKDYRHLECSHLSPKTKISNLLLTGQNINLHGILGVPLNAIITVGTITGKGNELVEKISKY
jgi:all-trans-retinol 13,14-reductase